MYEFQNEPMVSQTFVKICNLANACSKKLTQKTKCVKDESENSSLAYINILLFVFSLNRSYS